MVAGQHHCGHIEALDLVHEKLQHVVAHPGVVKHVPHHQHGVGAQSGHRIHHVPQRLGRFGMPCGVTKVDIGSMDEPDFLG